MGRFRPDRRRLATTALLLCVLPGAFLLRRIPPSADVLELRALAEGVLGVLLGLPVRLLDAATGDAFAPRSEGFLAFPSALQLAFALAVDALALYMLACLLASRRERLRPSRRRPARSAPRRP